MQKMDKKIATAIAMGTPIDQKMNKKIATVLDLKGYEFQKLKTSETNAVDAVQSYLEGLADRFKRRAKEFSDATSGERAKFFSGKVIRVASNLADVFLEACAASGLEKNEIEREVFFALEKRTVDDLLPRGLGNRGIFDFDAAVAEIADIVRTGETLKYPAARVLLGEMNVTLVAVDSDLLKVIR